MPEAPKSTNLIDPKTVWSELQRFQPEMEAALPNHISAARMARLALTALRVNPKLFQCTRESFMGSLILASQLGLEPGVMGQCYLIPYKQTCTLVPGWRGLLDLVKRSGRATASSRAIFEGDEYDFAFGDRPYIHHKPGPHYGEAKAMLYTYAVGWVKDCEWPEIDVWDIKRIWEHRNKMNKIGDQHYSYAHPEMYARKIPLLQVLKYLPTSIELSTAITLEGTGTSKPMDMAGLLTDGIEETEVEGAMEALGWDEAKREGFRDSYSGRPKEALEYLKAEAAKAKKATPAATTKKATPAATVESAANGSAASTADVGPSNAPAEPAKAKSAPAQADLGEWS